MHNTAGKNYVNAVISYLIAAVENIEFSTRKIEYNQRIELQKTIS